MGKKLLKVLFTIACMVATTSLFAEGGMNSSDAYWVPLGAAIAIAIAALGGTLGQGMAIKSAMEGVSRNPEAAGKMFTMFILGLAFIEAQAIFAFAISFLILGKI